MANVDWPLVNDAERFLRPHWQKPAPTPHHPTECAHCGWSGDEGDGMDTHYVILLAQAGYLRDPDFPDPASALRPAPAATPPEPRPWIDTALCRRMPEVDGDDWCVAHGMPYPHDV